MITSKKQWGTRDREISASKNKINLLAGKHTGKDVMSNAKD